MIPHCLKSTDIVQDYNIVKDIVEENEMKGTEKCHVCLFKSKNKFSQMIYAISHPWVVEIKTNISCQ